MYSRTVKYTLGDDKLTIDWGNGFVSKLSLVTKKDDIDWDPYVLEQLACISDDELFFYETGWDGEPATNAMYLVKKNQ